MPPEATPTPPGDDPTSPQQSTPEPAPKSAQQSPLPAADFDEFYVATRRRLLLQTFALTGDLTAARHAVRDSFVQARHHWRKLSRMDQPEEWVRPRAWAIAQRRSVGKIWHKEKGLSDDQAKVLGVLHKLPDNQRKALLLTHLASLSMAGIGREIGETLPRTHELLQQATAQASMALNCDSTAIRSRLEMLSPLVATHGLPRASIVRRDGKRRQRWHALGAAVAAVGLTLGTGAFVTAGGDDTPVAKKDSGPTYQPTTRAMLLRDHQVAPLPPRKTWRILQTGDNTTGSGLNSVCQESRFADPQGVRTLVRKFRSAGKPVRDLVETIEVSATPGAARRAYATTVGWYSGCRVARVQLVQAYKVTGIGQTASAMKLRVPGRTDGTYLVGFARSGKLTLSTVLRADGTTFQSIEPLLQVLATGMRNACESDDTDGCFAGTPVARKILPPRSPENPGMLATTDLPPVGQVVRPWIGTDPQLARPNLAATTCDETNFVTGGAIRPQSRTFLIPQARVPERFGITETIGNFRTKAQATRFYNQIGAKMAGCEDKQLGSTVSQEFHNDKALYGSRYQLWRLDNEINSDREKVGYWMGIAQRGTRVLQLNFAPAPHADLGADQFRDLLVRARDRLLELDRVKSTPTPSPSPSPSSGSSSSTSPSPSPSAS